MIGKRVKVVSGWNSDLINKNGVITRVGDGDQVEFIMDGRPNQKYLISSSTVSILNKESAIEEIKIEEREVEKVKVEDVVDRTKGIRKIRSSIKRIINELDTLYNLIDEDLIDELDLSLKRIDFELNNIRG